MNPDTDDTPDTPAEPIQGLRDEQTNVMLTVLATLANIKGITLDFAQWPHLDETDDEGPQRYRATVSFFVP